MSYVYMYYDPSRGEPIYVGKGNGHRDTMHMKRKDHHPLTYRLRAMKKIGVDPIITRICNDVNDELALLVEEEAISKFGRRDLGLGTLLNLTDGGDGAKGAILSDDHRLKLSQALKGRIVTPETRALMSKVRTGETRSEDTRARISAAKRGQKYSDEARANISAGHVGMTYTSERNAKVSVSLMGHFVSDETRAKISEKAKQRTGERNPMFGRTQSAESRKRIGDAQRAAAARKRELRGESL